jgi:hypothetical protein
LPRDLSTTFTIGTKRITVCNLEAHRTTVIENGRALRTIPHAHRHHNDVGLDGTTASSTEA